jgi:hypothetical protein
METLARALPLPSLFEVLFYRCERAGSGWRVAEARQAGARTRIETALWDDVGAPSTFEGASLSALRRALAHHEYSQHLVCATYADADGDSLFFAVYRNVTHEDARAWPEDANAWLKEGSAAAYLSDVSPPARA